MQADVDAHGSEGRCCQSMRSIAGHCANIMELILIAAHCATAMPPEVQLSVVGFKTVKQRATLIMYQAGLGVHSSCIFRVTQYPGETHTRRRGTAPSSHNTKGNLMSSQTESPSWCVQLNWLNEVASHYK